MATQWMARESAVAQDGKREHETDRAIFPVPARPGLRRTVARLAVSSETCVRLQLAVILCDNLS